jgi:hypothetical protein
MTIRVDVTFIPVVISIVRLSQIKSWVWPSVLLAALEGVTGVLYIAITVALLVGRFRSEFAD